MMIRRVVGALAALYVISASKHHRHRVPIIELNGAEKFIGTIREDEKVLHTVPELSIASESGPICEYRITMKDGTDTPFTATIDDRYTGSATLRLKDSAKLNCKKASYELNVVAVKCEEETTSDAVSLSVTIKDTNDHEPVFQQEWYTASIDEGKLSDEIVRVAATDEDCGHPYGEICEYEITNGDKMPFEINNKGVIRNSRALNASSARSYILTVVAHDCGMKKSKSALVTVNVKQACTDGVKDVPERVAFDVSAKKDVNIMPKAKLDLCPEDNKCTVASLLTKVALHTSHVDDFCGREDTPLYTKETIDRCGLTKAGINLLSAEKNYEGVPNGQEKNLFDGQKRADIVPSTVYDGLIPDRFALSFSMKHAAGSKQEQAGKQHVLCETDESQMNRHHFAVFVRHCKLEVVLRREAGANPEFRAAEWRWTLPEVCDNKWHSYALLFKDIDHVELVLDGKKFAGDDRNPEILDDWPLHTTSNVKTRLVVGACWHARSQSLAQFFKGSLAHVHLVAGQTEETTAVQCAHSCPERLAVEGDKNTVGNTDIELRANTVDEMQEKMRKVVYGNSLAAPVPGHRTFKVQTTVECKEQGKTIALPESKHIIFVKKPSVPVLSISGQATVTANAQQLSAGTTMLPELKITVSQANDEGKVADVTATSKLDFCKVHFKPSRDMDLEYFSSPATLIAATKIDFEHDKQGMQIKGGDWASTYQEVLQKMHYFNTRPDEYTKRIYAVQCAMDNSHVLSNEFIVTMEIVPEATTSSPIPVLSLGDDASAEELARHYEPAFDSMAANRLQNILEMELPRPKALTQHRNYDLGHGAVAGGAVAVVVVVCVGFLLVLLVVGVLKMRDTPVPRRHRRNRRSQDGMEWDDAGMNITVNPLDDVEKNAAEFSDDDEEESDDDNSECSYHDEEMSEDDDEEDEDETEILPVNHQAPPLEWDDEAHSPSTTPKVVRPPSSRSYRV